MNTVTEQDTQSQTAFDRALALYNQRTDYLNALPSDTDPAHEDEACDLRTAAEQQLFNKEVQSIADVRALAEVIFVDRDALPMPGHTTALLNALRKIDTGNPSRTFNPSAWLRGLERHGGGWVVQDDKVSFLYPGEKTDAMKGLMWELETRDGCEAVKAEIRRREAQSIEEAPKPTWAQLLSTYQTTEAKLAEHEQASDPNYKAGSPECEAYESLTEKLTDAHTDALEALFRYPSPDAEAYLIKARAFGAHQAYMWNTGKELSDIIVKEAAELMGNK